MSKKNNIINNNIIPEKEIVEDEITPEETPQILTKPKRQISDVQRQHLNKIRAKAMEKKAEMKQDTLKAKLAKTIEEKNQLKNMMTIHKKKKKKQ